MQIQGGEQFVITRQLEDPTDSNTYYVKALVRKANDDSLIDTINLTDKGEQRFRGNFDVPQYTDPTYVTITTEVYTDSGYTTESNLYARVEETFLIQQRWSMAMGGAGGSDINYKKIREIITEEINKIEKPELKNITNNKTVIEKTEMNLMPILNLFQDIQESIKTIQNKKEKDVNLLPITKDILRIEENISKAIKGIEKTDLSAILTDLKAIKDSIKESDDNFGKGITKIENNTKKEEKDLFKEKLIKRRKIFLGV